MSLSIAVVTETFHPFAGGSAKRYLEVFKRLAKKGFNVDLYTVRLDGSWPTKEEYQGITIYRTDEVLRNYITRDGFRSASAIIKYITWVLRKLDGAKYDVLEVNHCPIFPVFAAYLRKKNAPMVSTIHEVWMEDWYKYSPTILHVPIGITLEKMMMGFPDLLISVSNFTTERLIKKLRVPRSRIVTISNGVDLSLINEVKADKEFGRLVYGGRLNPHKRLDILIKSFEILYKRLDVTLDIFGDGPMKNYIMKYINRNGLSKRVNLYGRVDDTTFIKLMKRGYIYTLPSVREGQSITTLEAMASGTPQVLVYSSNNAAYKMVLEAESGLVSKPDPRSYSEKLEKLLQDKHLWNKLRDNGLKYVRRYDWDVVAEEHRIVYELIARR